MIICITGLAGSGKTTVAKLLQQQLSSEHKVHLLNSDMVGSAIFTEKYQKIIGDPKLDYTNDELNLIYQILYFSCEQGFLIDKKLVIITDGMYRQASQRLILRSIADRFDVPFLLLKTQINPETARQRLEKRAHEGGLGGWVNPEEYEMPYDKDLIEINNDFQESELTKELQKIYCRFE